jgi:hypothetical protein
MMKFTPPEPPKEEAKKPVEVDDPLKWRDGFPAERGRWYICSNAQRDNFARYARADGTWGGRAKKTAFGHYITERKETRYDGASKLEWRTERPDWLPKE